MRDAVELQGKKINYQDTPYVIQDFYLVPNRGEIYVKLKKLTQNIFLNVSLSSLMITLQQQIKL